ncbi:MAG: indole-3-glycerol phosphate synthase TrpC [candidate division WOR-3 bacterium]
MKVKTILDKIIDFKKVEIEKRKDFKPLESFIDKIPEKTRDFKKALRNQNITIIAEIKRQSPSRGILRDDFNHISIAKEYEKDGASAISVLTDAKFFWGDNEHLSEIKKEVKLPVLRKEFIIDEYQIYQSAYIGADAILLIAKILEFKQLEKFINLAHKLQMACMVEVDSRKELQKVLSTSAEIIGINNRDLETFQTSIENSLNLKNFIPEDRISVSESGIKKREDIVELEKAGFDSVLIGETLIIQKEIGKKLQELLGK